MSDKRIEDYALIGDGETAALIHRDATIEWLCLPRFDSEACFAALLGNEENGCWKMAPCGEIRETSRSYRGDTLILETDIATATGKVRLTDFMPTVRAQAPDVVRIVECLEGEVEMTSELIVRFDYGRIHPLVRSDGGGPSVAISGPDGVKLDFDPPIEFADRRFTSRVTLREGERDGRQHGEREDRGQRASHACDHDTVGLRVRSPSGRGSPSRSAVTRASRVASNARRARSAAGPASVQPWLA